MHRSIGSLVVQTFKHFDVFVCDDGSTDETRSVVESYQNQLNINWLYCENFGGPARPRNIGIKASKSKYIAFLDADDWWSPEKLEISVDCLNKGYDFVYHDLKVLPDNSRSIKVSYIKTRDLKKPVFNDLLYNGNGIANSSVVTKRSYLLKINGFSENINLIATEDYDAWLRLSKLNIKFFRIKVSLGYYSLGDDNISSANKTIIFINSLISIYCKCSKYGLFTTPTWMNLSLARAFYNQKKYIKMFRHLIWAILTNPICTSLKIVGKINKRKG